MEYKEEWKLLAKEQGRIRDGKLLTGLLTGFLLKSVPERSDWEMAEDEQSDHVLRVIRH